jgi:SAM-dependent methyltransferase
MTDVCRICGSDRVRSFQRLGARYAVCAECEALTKVLTLDEYHALRPTYDPGELAADASAEEVRRLLDIQAKIRLLEPLARRLSHGRFLDVGCGMGGYLLAARELGFDVVGVEPSEAHSRVARQLFGLTVHTAYFQDVGLPDESFSLVVLSHVIEHIYEPQAFLRDLLRVVAPGGSLLVITPNPASTAARMTGRWWTMLKSLDHVSMLSKKSFGAMDVLHGYDCTFRTSEYRAEPLAAVLASARDAVRELRAPHPSDGRHAPSHEGTVKVAEHMHRRRRLRWLFDALAVLSVPLHAYNVLTDQQGCLVAEIHKPR